ncbi:MAG: immunity 17 family protein [Bacteroidaceae bacterium]|nr:immunity 17 family protein [Bacteroidaceae bacterium]
MAKYFMMCIFALAGIVSSLAAAFNWDWFFTAQNAQYAVKRLGRQKARIAYGLLGLLLIAMAVYFYKNTPPS